MEPKMFVVEMQDEDSGYRRWSSPMPESEIDAYIKQQGEWGWSLSDIDYCSPEFLAERAARLAAD